MKDIRTNQSGIGHLALLLALTVVLAVGVVGWRVMQSNQSTAGTTLATPVATLKTPADVKQAASALDSTDVDTSMNPDQLDSDLNSLL